MYIYTYIHVYMYTYIYIYIYIYISVRVTATESYGSFLQIDYDLRTTPLRMAFGLAWHLPCPAAPWQPWLEIARDSPPK